MPRRLKKQATKTDWQASIEHRRLSDLHPHKHNPKTHSEAQIRAIARSLSVHKFVNPILIDAEGVIIAGHGRYEAAKQLALETVPTILLGHLTTAQQRAYRIADNKLAEVGSGWSIEMLNLEVDAILELDADFDLSLTGFDARDLKIGLDVAEAEAVSEEPDIPDLPKAAVSRLGDLWQIGDHCLLCGDALKAESYENLMGRDRATMVFADSPYNVPIQGHVTGNGRTKHREFVAGSGEMSDAGFRQFLLSFMNQCVKFSKDGSLHYLCMDWRHLAHLLAAGGIAYDEYKNLCVWVKQNGGLGSLYRSQHELIAIFKHGTAAHINNIELGKNGRNRSNVWSYAGMNSFAKERDELLQLHPTVKPFALVRDAIFDASMRDDIVLDPFGGSGTTLLAADAARRRARLIELDPRYCDVIVKRAQQTLSVEAVLASTGQTFAAVAAERGVTS